MRAQRSAYAGVMPSTVAGILVAVAVVLPGFVIAELSVVGRARAARSDLELVLRALFYALILHSVASPFTKMLADEMGSLSNWQAHLLPLVAYTSVALVIVPVVVGLILGAHLRSVERHVEEGEPDPRLVGPYAPPRGIYVAADEVRSIRVFPSREGALQLETL